MNKHKNGFPFYGHVVFSMTINFGDVTTIYIIDKYVNKLVSAYKTII